MNNKSINNYFFKSFDTYADIYASTIIQHDLSPTTGYQQKYIWSKICRLLIQPKNVEEYNEPHDIE